MTVEQIKQKIGLQRGISKVHIYRLFKKLHIEPLGSSRPQNYPADTADLLLTHLGLAGADTAPTASHNRRARSSERGVLSMKALRHARKQNQPTKK
ncbi:MAG TPA: hypothetical protein VF607_06935 [Verrucomicrobiae bacterium]